MPSTEIYVNPMHKFYKEFIELSKKAFPDCFINKLTVEELIEIGKDTVYKDVFKWAEEVCKFLDFAYTEDFVLVHYKPYYALDNAYKNVLEGKTNIPVAKTKEGEDVWNLWGGLLKYARGMVFHRYSGAVVINPYSKFFNIDEREECSEINIFKRIEEGSIIEFSEKLDGSMINGRWFNGKLVLSSSNNLEEDKCIQLAEAYKLIDDKIENMMKDYRHLTFIFELISPQDIHVVDYGGESKLVLIGIKSTHFEYAFSYEKVREIGGAYDTPCATVYDTSLKKILDSRGEKKAEEAEGFVANIDGYRVKIKYEDYLKVHGTVSSLTPNIIVRAVADNCVEELKLNCKAKGSFIDYVLGRIEKYIELRDREIKRAYKRIMVGTNHEERGEFMRAVQEKISPGLRKYVIMMYDEKYSVGALLKSGSGRYIKYKEIEAYLNNKND